MYRDSEVAQHVREDTQLAAVSVELRGKARQAGTFGDDEYSPLETFCYKIFHVVAGNFSRRPGNSAGSGGDSLIQ